jgi:hypothetical protein
MAGRCLTATYDFSSDGISFCELPVVRRSRQGYIIQDGDEEITFQELDVADTVATLFTESESTDEVRADLEERLRLRLAHWNLIHPNKSLKYLN